MALAPANRCEASGCSRRGRHPRSDPRLGWSASTRAEQATGGGNYPDRHIHYCTSVIFVAGCNNCARSDHHYDHHHTAADASACTHDDHFKSSHPSDRCEHSPNRFGRHDDDQCNGHTRWHPDRPHWLHRVRCAPRNRHARTARLLDVHAVRWSGHLSDAQRLRAHDSWHLLRVGLHHEYLRFFLVPSLALRQSRLDDHHFRMTTRALDRHRGVPHNTGSGRVIDRGVLASGKPPSTGTSGAPYPSGFRHYRARRRMAHCD